MTTINNTTVDWKLSPRLFWIPVEVDDVIAQDYVDTARKIHEYDLMNLSQVEHLVDAAGKEALGGGTLVGITVTSRNVQIAFKPDTDPKSSGTVTTADPSGTTLIDTGATFQTDGVEPGALLINLTDVSLAAVITVDSEIQITHTELGGGTENDWDVGEDYVIWNTVQKTVLGGNVVAVDGNGNEISAIFPTPLTQVIMTRSSSATLQDLEAIQYASFGGGVTVDDTSFNSGTSYPVGTKEYPVNNIPDAVEIANERGFTRLYIINGHTLDTGDNVENFEIYGESQRKTLITVNTGALTQNAEFHSCTVTGVFDNEADFCDCILQDIQFVRADIYRCVLEGTITLSGSGATRVISCYSGVAGTSTPTIDMGGSGQELQVRQYSGGIKLVNKSGQDNVSLDFVSGHAKLDSTVTGGTIVIRGNCKVTDDSNGATVNNEHTMDNLLLTMERVAGLVHENHYIDQMTYSGGNLETARIRIYSSPSSVGTDSDVVATYDLTATHDVNGLLQSYKVVKA